MSKAEMRLMRVQKSLDKTLKMINDCRTGTKHLMDLLTVNAKLLHPLPRSIPPRLESDEDIIRCLSWMEERILGINEAIMLDAGKPQGGVTDDTKSLPARQTELAQLVQNMLKAGGSFDPKVTQMLASKFVCQHDDVWCSLCRATSVRRVERPVI
jgi:hypothetical protein